MKSKDDTVIVSFSLKRSLLQNIDNFQHRYQFKTRSGVVAYLLEKAMENDPYVFENEDYVYVLTQCCAIDIKQLLEFDKVLNRYTARREDVRVFKGLIGERLQDLEKKEPKNKEEESFLKMEKLSLHSLLNDIKRYLGELPPSRVGRVNPYEPDRRKKNNQKGVENEEGAGSNRER